MPHSNRKSSFLLGLLIIASALQYILFSLSTGTILLFLLTLITGFHILLKKLKKRYPGRFLKIISRIFRCGLAIIGILSIITLILIIRPIKACRQFDAGKVMQATHIIVLGAGLNGDQVSERLKLRLDKAVEALRVNSDALVIVSGGQGSDELMTEAEAMKEYLVRAGIDDSRIIKEERSTSTYENFLYSKKILDKIGPSKEILIITSDFHAFRSEFIAKKLGWDNARVLCSKSAPLLISNNLIREIPAVINDFIRLK